MALLKIEDAELPNKDGELIPQEQKIEVIGEKPTTAKVLPCLDEEFGQIVDALNSKQSKNNEINNLISEKVLEPKMTVKQIRFLKPTYKTAIFKAILKATGVDEKAISQKNILKDEKKE